MNRASDQPPGDWYEIRIQGHLDQRWAAWLDGDLSRVDGGTTLVRARVADQAALHGLLNKVRDLGVRLLSVTQVETGSPAPPYSQAPITQNRSTP